MTRAKYEGTLGGSAPFFFSEEEEGSAFFSFLGNRLPKCDVTKILFLECYDFGLKF